MNVNSSRTADIAIPSELVDAIRSFPIEKEIEHCGQAFSVSPLSIYATCPKCGTEIKHRSFAAIDEIEDVFDAVIEWMNRPGAERVVRERMVEIAEDEGD